MQHNYEKHFGCIKDHCNICDGGLSYCLTCGGAESSLTTDCPGRKLSSEEQDKVSSGELDYIGGKWVNKSTK